MGNARIHVAALTLGSDVPSARFRVRQFIPALERRRIAVSEYPPDPTVAGQTARALKRVGYSRAAIPIQWLDTLLGRRAGIRAARRSDITWISKQLVPGIPTLEKVLPRPIVLDVDDAMWLARPFGEAAARLAARTAECVVTGSRQLAEYYAQHNSNVHVVPTAIDLERFYPGPPRPPAGAFTIVWTGSRSTLPFLEALDRCLRDFFQKTPEARLLVICDASPRFQHLDTDRVDFLSWSPELESSALRAADVGIMPLPDTRLARGKCSFKMLQYMATGLPVIASPVGPNDDILRADDVGWPATDDSEWFAALMACSHDQTLAIEKGKRGRAVVARDYGLEPAADKLAQIFRELGTTSAESDKFS